MASSVCCATDILQDTLTNAPPMLYFPLFMHATKFMNGTILFVELRLSELTTIIY